MSKLIKKDLFSPTDPKPVGLIQAHPASSSAEVEKVMVMLSPRQVHSLDRICLEIRKATGLKMKRSMLIRSLIDGFLQSQVHFEEARTSSDIQRLISRLFHHH
jgi:hypothetical protein